MIVSHSRLKELWTSVGPSARWAYTALIFALFEAFSSDGVVTVAIAKKAIENRQLRSKLTNELLEAGLLQRVEAGLWLCHYRELTQDVTASKSSYGSVSTRRVKCLHSPRQMSPLAASNVSTRIDEQSEKQADFSPPDKRNIDKIPSDKPPHPVGVWGGGVSASAALRARSATPTVLSDRGQTGSYAALGATKESLSSAFRSDVAPSAEKPSLVSLKASGADEVETRGHSTASVMPRAMTRSAVALAAPRPKFGAR